MTKTVEYRVRPVTRYHVTRFENEDYEDGRCSGGCESLGEFDNESHAFKVADALLLHEIKDCPKGVIMTSARGNTPSQTRNDK